MSERHEDIPSQPRPLRIFFEPRAVDGEQKRAFERTTTTRDVPVRVAGEAAPVTARLVNVSPTGLQFALPMAPTSDTVEIDVLPGRILAAVVRWSRAHGREFLVGAEWKAPLPYDEVWRIRAFETPIDE